MLELLPNIDVIGRDTPVADKGSWAIQRNQNVVCVLLDGVIVDEVSEGWRARCQKSFDEDGYPPFGYVDARTASVAQTLPARMRAAAFMRRSAERMKRIVLVSGREGTVGFVMKTVMRAAGVGNVVLVDPDAGARALEAMRDGKDPFAT
jgi:hypothetical protein